MSLRVTWDGALPAGEPMDVVMEDCTSWTPANTVLKAGRELSSWFFKRPSTQPRPLFSVCSSPRQTSFYDTNSPMDMDISKKPLNINDLPLEVLGEIFIAYLNTPDPDDSYEPHNVARYRVSSQLHSPSSPILLGQVCSNWRAFTHSLPTLWRKISVSCPRPQDISLFAQWLERSGEMPIDLTLVDRLGTNEVSITAIREGFRLALTQSHRWSAVTFDLVTDVGDLIPTIDLASQGLQSFDMKITHWREESLASLLQLFYASPKLRQTRYSLPSSSTSFSCLSRTPLHLLPCITHLEIGMISTEDLFSLLGRYTALEDLSFRISSGPNQLALLATPLYLPTIRTLRVDHGYDLIPVLNSLCLPFLTSLVLPSGFNSMLSPSYGTNEGWGALFGLIERSRMQLQSLTFKVRGMDEGIVTNAIASPLLASLKHLNIRSPVTDQLVKALTDTPNILPQLEALELDSCNTSDGVLSGLILARRESLKAVAATLVGSRSFPQDLALKLPGVNIHF